MFDAVRPYWEGGDPSRLNKHIAGIILVVRTGYAAREEESVSYVERLKTVERELIREEVSAANGRVCKAALALGMDRKVLYRKMKRLGLSRPREERQEKAMAAATSVR